MEEVSLARVSGDMRRVLAERGLLAKDLTDLIAEL